MSKKRAPAAQSYVCPITNLPLVYCGRGRPPKYHADAAKEVAKRRNAEAYKRRKEASARERAKANPSQAAA